jgi:hypothetical protein
MNKRLTPPSFSAYVGIFAGIGAIPSVSLDPNPRNSPMYRKLGRSVEHILRQARTGRRMDGRSSS